MRKAMGRPSIFSPKNGKQAYHILALTREGQRMFEDARKRLKTLARELIDWKGKVSDADTVEFMLRGEAATVAYLKAKG